MSLTTEHLRGGFAFEASTADGITYGVLATPEDLVAIGRPLYMVVKDTRGERQWCRWARSIEGGKALIADFIETHRAFANVPPHRRAKVGHTGRGGE